MSRLDRLSATAIRARFEKRFTARRMAEDYVALYRRMAVQIPSGAARRDLTQACRGKAGLSREGSKVRGSAGATLDPIKAKPLKSIH